MRGGAVAFASVLVATLAGAAAQRGGLNDTLGSAVAAGAPALVAPASVRLYAGVAENRPFAETLASHVAHTRRLRLRLNRSHACDMTQLNDSVKNR